MINCLKAPGTGSTVPHHFHNPTCVHPCFQLLQWTRRLLGRWLFRRLMWATFYGQFAGGETDEEILAVAKHYTKYGLQPMFAYTAMEVHGNARG